MGFAQPVTSTQQNGGVQPATEATLDQLLSSEDLLKALEENQEKLDADLLHLVHSNMSAARDLGEQELAEGLEALADYIKEVIVANV